VILKNCPLRERVFSIRAAGVLSSVVRYLLTYLLLHPGMESETVLVGAGVGVRWFWYDRISVTSQSGKRPERLGGNPIRRLVAAF